MSREEENNEMKDGATCGKASVVVYDFDGTLIDGNSPVLLVRYLIAKNMLTPSTSLKIGVWALAYKFRLPQNESWVRGLVFEAFQGWPTGAVDEFLRKFYDDVVEPRFRIQGIQSMNQHLAAGRCVIVVSASFEPIVQRAMELHGFDGQASTRMKVTPEGTYSREVDGLPVEGKEKLARIRNWCDARFGEGNWQLDFAYGDHHSDEPMLSRAKCAFAVCPDQPLERTAKKNGWSILMW